MESGSGGDLCVLRRGEGNAYTVTFASDGTSIQFDALLFQAEQVQVLDLTLRQRDDFQVPGHALIRILASGNALRWTYLDSEWLRQQAGQELPNRALDNDKMLLTAAAGLLREFLAKYAADDRAHADTEEFERVQ